MEQVKNERLALFEKLEKAVVANVEPFSLPVRKYGPSGFKKEEIINTINGAPLEPKIGLSRVFFEVSQIYKRLIIYYASLLNYDGILVPLTNEDKHLSEVAVQKKYFQAIDYIDNLNLPNLFFDISLRVLRDGAYRGVITKLDKTGFTKLELPLAYTRVRFKHPTGEDILEFDVTYFNQFKNSPDSNLEAILRGYPDEIRKYYLAYSKGKKKSRWCMLLKTFTFSFSIGDTITPMFLATIPAILDYDETVDVEKARDLEEIKKLLILKIPHVAATGELVFDPPEAEVMHKGAVGMMKGNKNVSVLTTYADAEVANTKTASDNLGDNLKKMLRNIYAQSSTTSELFIPDSSQSVLTSIRKDISLMMVLARKYSIFVAAIINKLFKNTVVHFDYQILPTTIYTQSEYITDTFKLAQSGYSYMLPALAAGLSQRNFCSVKDLENEVLGLRDRLLPLQSAYTQSAKDNNEAGAPEKTTEEKAATTIVKEDSINKMGG